MNIELKNFVDLQNIDIRIIELENSKQEFPLEVIRLEGEIQAAINAVAKVEKELGVANADKNIAEERIFNAQKILERSQERLNSIKTNKEYDAVHSEIETNKQLVDSGSKKIQKHEEVIEAVKNRLTEANQKLEAVKEDNQPIIDDLKSKIANIDFEVAKVTQEREVVLPLINKNFIRSYDLIRKRRKNGKTLAVITSTDRTCTICFQKLQPNIFNQTRKATEIIYCQNCGSILVWQGNIQEEPSAPVTK